MNENHNKENKPKVIGLKGVSNTVKQSFSHGRSKSVVVETKKKKVLFTKKAIETDKKTETVSETVFPSEASSNEELLRKKKAMFIFHSLLQKRSLLQVSQQKLNHL